MNSSHLSAISFPQEKQRIGIPAAIITQDSNFTLVCIPILYKRGGENNLSFL